MAKVAVHLSSGIAVSIPIERNIENGLLNLVDALGGVVMAWLAVAVFAVVVGLAAGWLLDRHAGRRRGARR